MRNAECAEGNSAGVAGDVEEEKSADEDIRMRIVHRSEKQTAIQAQSSLRTLALANLKRWCAVIVQNFVNMMLKRFIFGK
ncbi:MAG: hypothetical protein LBH31_07975 [Burkholderiaceae bacterium]|jgi:hypothetical protein|nr:hypothetical protein [Burkholderiaceae bacterium]